ncbi:hypothetical protein EPUS_03700 [Endocarpon pusillum Z07020]|uniref:F-box domain-containing protein n=1 Tax=Endocarpon pusillum (strain Z07020 / HMAS-L-300199) TaxID=1263415 RepID=U1GCD3_ENDPU|nr:uncharacterized protein EPUS_03700 [Endocarpon pusillum Z07020]ERF69708.1 hypothetical protein EPUS_03700 [Endocarpon pusillum Z07020]
MGPNSLKRLSVRFGRSKPSQRSTEPPPGSVLPDHISLQLDPLPQIRSISPTGRPRRDPPPRDLSTLPALPAEILLAIADHLDDASTICLSATSYRLSEVLCALTRDLRERERSRCAKWLIMAQLERGLVIDPRGQNADVKLTCVLCKVKLAISSFERYHPPTTNPSFMENGFESLHMLSRMPCARFCEHHAMRTVLGRESSDPRRNADQTIRWECCRRRMCLHCGTVPSDGSPPSCACTCPVCPKDAQVPTFVRYGLARAGEKAADDLRVFFLRFERGAAGGGPLLAVERVHRRDERKWIEAPITKLPVEFR